MEEIVRARKHFLLVPEALGQSGLILCKQLGILDRKYKILKNTGKVSIPLVRSLTNDETTYLRNGLSSFELGEEEFEPNLGRRPTVRQILMDTVPQEFLRKISRSLSTVGDLAIVEVLEELSGFDEQIGNAILTANPNVKTVLKKASSIQGTHRTREYRVIAGEKRTVTIHREYGCSFYLDLSRVYFNPRLGYERNRISRLVNEGEMILDMFAGVGPFSIQIARRVKNIKVIAVDINPAAIEYLRKNIEANRVQDRVLPVLGDVERTVQEKIEGRVDRVIMNLPGSSEKYINTACRALGVQGGIAHYYRFSGGDHAIERAEEDFVRGVKEAGRRVEEVMMTRRVVATAPREWQIGIDARIR